MFLTCSHACAIEESCPSRPGTTGGGGDPASGFASGRRPARSHPGTFELAHCEELKNADGPPDGTAPVRKSRSDPGRAPLPARGAPRATSKPSWPKVRDLTTLRKVWTLSTNDESSNQSSSPGCRWQGRAGRDFPSVPSGGARAPAAHPSFRRRPESMNTEGASHRRPVFMDPGLCRDDEGRARPAWLTIF
jgi:hypothetical protein